MRAARRIGVVFAALGALLAGCDPRPAAEREGQEQAMVGPEPQPIVAARFLFEDAPTPQCHASTIVETADGGLVAAWFGGLHERHPEVRIFVSRFEEGRWQVPVAVADGRADDGSRLPTWNPVLFQPPMGDLQLFYKVGPDPQSWHGMRMRSPDGGRSWAAAEPLPDGILGPIKNKPVVTGMGGWLSPSSRERGSRWTLHFEHSADQGRTWRATDPVERGPELDAIQPSILTHADGRLQAIARTRQGVLASTWSTDRGQSWSPLHALALPNPNAGTDAVTLADGRQLLVYNPTAHQPLTPGKGLRYPLAVALSEDGLDWREVLVLEDEPLAEGYAYPAVIQSRDGLVHVTYTWGRTRIRHVVIDPAQL